MTCSVCCQENTRIQSLNVDCVEFALESIKRHYLFLQKTMTEQKRNFDILRKQNEKYQKKLKCDNDKDQEIVLLQQRNEKLTRAVALLQRESQKNENHPPPPLKRRKSQFADSTFSDDDESSKFNMALNSVDLLDSSTFSSGLDDTIVDAQNMNKSRASHLLKEHNQNNNNNNKIMTNTSQTLTKSEWISKQCDSQTISSDNRSVNLNSAKSGTKRASMSLNLNTDSRGRKMKQTRLQFDVKQDKNSNKFSDEIIVASPNPHLSNRNQTRSILQRKDNSAISFIPDKTKSNYNADDGNDNDDDDDDDDDDVVFQSEISSEFELRPIDNVNEPKKVLLDLLKTDESDKSVLLLTPATQDIVFIDDTLNNSTHINSMDLVQDLIQCGDNSLAKLRRIETEKIKQLQKDAEKKKESLSHLEKTTDKSLTVNNDKFKTPLKMKKEPATQLDSNVTMFETNKKSTEKNCASNEEDKETDSDDEFMVRPMIVKLEPSSPQKIDIKSLYNIECKDCEKYIKFMGNNMTKQEIEEHIAKCMTHKQKDNFVELTPEDFWNPFIQSFQENDPRNEVLIDRRFVNKQRKT